MRGFFLRLGCCRNFDGFDFFEAFLGLADVGKVVAADLGHAGHFQFFDGRKGQWVDFFYTDATCDLADGHGFGGCGSTDFED